MNAHAIVAGNATLGLLVLATLALVWRRNRSFLTEIQRDSDRGWRTIRRLAAATLAALIVWASLFDNWRQLTAIPFRATRQWQSQRALFDPPSTEARAVTLSLLAAALALTALLIARHLGGYLLPAIVALAALLAWLPFFVIRMRFTLDLAMGFDGSWTSPGDVAAYLGFAALSWAFDLGLIAVSFLGLAGACAIPVAILLDLLRLRRPRASTEAESYFEAIGDRIAP